ncbi:uncharacterized protein LOC124931403 [Impatiens glandulifera]|uniref:uncharacterized protein LOC124931403 n=1 Tax=Impatiens glandulifera TaxID=253017 RepID=UPI001FB0E3B8|nr:uncharacterized protein LOC124931403 [Impatiens glandulifera]
MVSEHGSYSSSNSEDSDSTDKNQEVKISNPNLTISEGSSSSNSDQETEARLKRRMAIKRKYNTDPLLLQNGDITGAIITNSILTRSHYYEWCTSIRLALEAKMKLGFIDGSCKMPLDADGVMQWKLVDAMVRNWIMNTMDQNLKIHFQNAVTAQQLWKDIRSTYEGNNGPRRFQLGKDISTIQQGTSDIVEHYSKVVSEVAQDVEEAKLLQFLMGVNDSYEHVVDNMLASDPWP